MAGVRIESIEDPFDADDELAETALRLILRAEFLGCLPVGTTALGPDAIRAVGRCLASAHLPSARWDIINRPRRPVTPAGWRDAINAMNDQVEMSPLPHGEWRPVTETLGEELVGSVLGVSTSSLRRYQSGARATPQDVAERLHFLALLLAELSGSYNDYGIRRWFMRPRTALAGRRPLDLLGASFAPDGPDGQALRDLVAGLAAAGAA
jgi:hypothetical protein